ncbi:unnamed protein product [Arctogadus glacialis]
MYIASDIDNYEVSLRDKVTGEISVRAVCHRSMRKSEKPHDLRVGCTDTEQIWHKPRTLGVRPGPVGEMEFRKPKNSTADCVRSSLYKAVDGELRDLAMLRVSEVYKDFPPSLAPLVTTMGMSADVPLVQSAFGAVQPQASTAILCLCSVRARKSAPEVSGCVIQHGPQDRSWNTNAEFVPAVASLEKNACDIYTFL